MRRQTVEQIAADRVRAFVADWSEPERQLVERMLAGESDQPVQAIERRSRKRADSDGKRAA